MKALKTRDGNYSVRIFGGYMALVIIAYLNISYTIATGFKEAVPTAYLISIDGIIAFYFFKQAIQNLRFNTKVDDATSNIIATKETIKESTNDAESSNESRIPKA